MKEGSREVKKEEPKKVEVKQEEKSPMEVEKEEDENGLRGKNCCFFVLFVASRFDIV